MRPPGAPLLVRRLTGYWRTVVASSPLRFGVERRWRSCAHPPHLPSAAAAEDQLRAHQARGDERPSALPPRPAVSPSRSSLPACARSTSAATRSPAARTPPASSSAARRSCAAPLLFAGPPSSTARLSHSSTQPSRELSYSTPLSQPFCEPVRLFCGCEPEELPKDPAEELPEELRTV